MDSPTRTFTLLVKPHRYNRLDPQMTVRFEVGAAYGQGREQSGEFTEVLARGVLQTSRDAETEVEVTLPGGVNQVWVRASEPGLAQIRSLVRGTEDRSFGTARLIAKPGATARGTIVNAEGQPTAADWISGERDLGDWLSADAYGNGSFEAHFAGDGPTVISCFAGSEGSGQVKLLRLRELDPPQDLVLGLGGSGKLSCVAIDRDGRAVPNVEMQLVHRSHAADWAGNPKARTRACQVQASGALFGEFHTDGRGALEATGLLPGEWAVWYRVATNKEWSRSAIAFYSTGDRVHEIEVSSSRLIVQVRGMGGQLMEFQPRKWRTSSFTSPSWSPIGKTLKVSITPAEGYVVPIPERTYSRKTQAQEYEWFPTGDPTCWELAIPPDTLYWLGLDGTNHESTRMQVVLRSNQNAQEVELLCGPKRKPGTVHLEVQNPPGTTCVSAYGITLVSELGVAVGSRIHTAHTPSDDMVSEHFRRDIVLPPGKYSMIVRPIHTGEGALCGTGISRDLEPGRVKTTIEVVEGKEHELVLHTKNQSYVAVPQLAGVTAWTLCVYEQESGDLRQSRQVAGEEEFTWVSLPAGDWMFEALVADRVVRRASASMTGEHFAQLAWPE